MEFNIALNTIIYVMLFLFPGTIFRRSFFTSAHTRQFYKENLFERFLWTMLFSILMLISVSLVFLIANRVFDLPLLSSFSYRSIKDVFTSISTNQLPDKNQLDVIYKDFITFIFALYLFSMISGYLCYFINARIFRFLKFENYWEDIFKGSYKQIKENNLVRGITMADVLIDTNQSTKLYSGKVVDYFLSRDNNQLETIILNDVTRYKKNENIENDEKVQLRYVPGHNFCVDNSKILNINVSYVYEEKTKSRYHKRICLFLDVIYVIMVLFLFVLLFLNTNLVFLSSTFKKLVFFGFTWTNLSIVKQMLKDIVYGEKRKIILDNLSAFIIFSIPYLVLFEVVAWWLAILLGVIAIIILGVLKKYIFEESNKK